MGGRSRKPLKTDNTSTQGGNDRLGSWKKIAAYLDLDITTVIRYAKQRGMPVHRVPGAERSRVFAYKGEIEAWLRNRPTGHQAGTSGPFRDSRQDLGDTDSGFLTTSSATDEADEVGVSPAENGGGETPEEILAEPRGPIDGLPRFDAKEELSAGTSGESAPGLESRPARDDGTPSESKSAIEPALRRGTSGKHGLLHNRWFFAAAGIVTAGVITTLVVFVSSSRNEPLPEVVATEQLTHDRLEKQGPLFADRSRVYFCEDSPQGCGLSYVSVKGGDTVSVPTPLPSIRPYDLSPDGSRFLVAGPVIEGRNSSLWVVPARGGSPERVGGIFASSAAWSPGGSRIAYVTGRSLYLASADGTRSHRLATLPMPPGDVRWSPDGQRLRFFITFGNPPQSLPYEIEVNGSGLHRLLKVWGSLGNGFVGNWTPDGRHYVFSLAASLGQRSIETVWSMSGRPGSRSIFGRHNSPPVRLGEDGRSYFAPVSSRDNSTIYVIGEERSGELVRYGRRDGEFVPYLNRLDGRWVTFSPDRRWVAFSNYSDGTVWCMHPDGTGKRQLTYAPSYADGIAWSPDGKWIAIDRQAAPGKWFKISLLRAPSARQGVWGADSAEGTVPEELLPADHANEGIPSWSPDSRRIAFGEMDGPTSSQGTGKEVIHICDLSSRRVSVVPGKKGVWTARWSPNGRYIAALTYDDRQQLELYDLKTRKWRDLGAEHIDNPTWSYDSRYIYYDADRGPRADAGIFRTRISDGKVELAAPYHGIRRADRTWSGLAPDDSPIVLRDVGIQEIYALHVKWQ